ncbi:MAG: hypothetical protein AAGJ87_12330, partial [Pseudomonadota bacterium]
DETPAQGTLATETSTSARLSASSRRSGETDDLTQIIGLNADTQRKLNEMGIYHLYQIADWGPARIQWVEEKLGEPGRVDTERWVAQARSLRMPAAATVSETEDLHTNA